MADSSQVEFEVGDGEVVHRRADEEHIDGLQLRDQLGRERERLLHLGVRSTSGGAYTAVLKSWIDYVVRPGYTFRLAPGWPGMLANKRARLIVVSRDSYDAGEPSEADDLVTPVLRKALSFMGINDVSVVRAGGSLAVNLGKVRIEDHLERYAPEVAALAGS